jgi:hypothetical protein
MLKSDTVLRCTVACCVQLLLVNGFFLCSHFLCTPHDIPCYDQLDIHTEIVQISCDSIYGLSHFLQLLDNIMQIEIPLLAVVGGLGLGLCLSSFSTIFKSNSSFNMTLQSSGKVAKSNFHFLCLQECSTRPWGNEA